MAQKNRMVLIINNSCFLFSSLESYIALLLYDTTQGSSHQGTTATVGIGNTAIIIGQRHGLLLLLLCQQLLLFRQRFGPSHRDVDGSGVCFKAWNFQIGQCPTIGCEQALTHANQPQVVAVGTGRHFYIFILCILF
jgi:hypothetical protein